jgi:diaminopimelate epimerase
MELSYILADPSGNTTAFVLSPVASDDYGPVARTVMDRLNAEQVAFIHDDRMDMMGGEFCGNASRSFALWQALHRPTGLSLAPLQGQLQQTVTVSGAPHPLTVTLRCDGTDRYYAAITMPLPQRVLPMEEPFLGPCTLVEYPGISHVLLENREPHADDPAAVREILETLDAEDGCFGLLYLEDNTLRPRVLVRDTCTDVWESSCASGTCAVAAALSLRQNASLELELFQPGGSLTASAIVEDGKLIALTLDGPVTFPQSGILTL